MVLQGTGQKQIISIRLTAIILKPGISPLLFRFGIPYRWQTLYRWLSVGVQLKYRFRNQDHWKTDFLLWYNNFGTLRFMSILSDCSGKIGESTFPSIFSVNVNVLLVM